MTSMSAPFAHCLQYRPSSHPDGFNRTSVMRLREQDWNRLQLIWKKNMRFTYRVVFAVCLAMLLSPGLLVGQSFLGSITGAVQDTSGAVIPGATVMLNSITTGQQLNAVTNSAGVYLFSNLQPGVYTVAVSHAGFSQVHSGNITLIAAENTRFDARLQVGKTTQTVNVSAAPPALNTENGLISNDL
jgi:hypothetical protein